MLSTPKPLLKMAIFFTSAFFLCFLIACDTSSKRENDLSLQRKTLATADGIVRLEAYNKLSPVDKRDIWLSKLNQTIASGALTTEQKKAIDALKGLINTRNIFEISDKNAIYRDQDISKWMNDYGDSFSYIEGFLIFASLHDYSAEIKSQLIRRYEQKGNIDKLRRTLKGQIAIDKIRDLNLDASDEVVISSYEEDPGDCSCYCVCRWDCYDTDCEDKYQNCDATGIGCGWFLLQSCTGRCKPLTPTNPS